MTIGFALLLHVMLYTPIATAAAAADGRGFLTGQVYAMAMELATVAIVGLICLAM